MTEPAGPISFSLFGIFVAALGPVLGPYALIIFGAGVGAGLALSAHKPSTRWEGVKFWLLATAIALLLTAPIVWAVGKYSDVPAEVALIPVAFVLGAAKPHLMRLISTVLDGLPAVLSIFSGAGKRGNGQ